MFFSKFISTIYLYVSPLSPKFTHLNLLQLFHLTIFRIICDFLFLFLLAGTYIGFNLLIVILVILYILFLPIDRFLPLCEYYCILKSCPIFLIQIIFTGYIKPFLNYLSQSAISNLSNFI